MNLVTGATGIIGSHVVLALLQNGEQVVACKQKSSNIKKVEELFSFYTKDHKQLFEKVTWVDVDIRDIFSIEEALEGITNVYHCAGFVSLDSRDRKKLFEINEKGTKNVVDACLQKKVSALCHVSSVATINNLDYTLPLNEDVFWKTSGKESDYAISKYNAEREVWRGIEEGLNAVIVNPGIVLSPGFWGQSSSRLFETCYNGNRFYTNGMAACISARDVARIMPKLVSKKLFGHRFILVENNYTYHNILSHIQSNFNKAVPSINASAAMLNLGRYLDVLRVLVSGKERKLTKAVVRASLNKQTFSNKKVKNTLGIELEPTHKVIEEICGHQRFSGTKTQPSL